MAVITSAQNGNFTDTATWVGGVVPGAGDDAVAAHIVTFDADVTVISFQQSGTGKFVLGNGRTVTGNVIVGAGTYTSGGTIQATMTTSATINGNVTGPSSTISNLAGVVATGSGTLTINGNLIATVGANGTSETGSCCVYINVTCTLNVNGVIEGQGQFKRGITIDTLSNATVNVIGNVLGSTTQSRGNAIVAFNNNATINVTGNVISRGQSNTAAIQESGQSTIINVTGFVKAGQGNVSHAIESGGSLCRITVTGDVVGGNSSIGAASYGVFATGLAAVISVIGNVEAGSGTGALFGIYATGTASLVSVVGSVRAATPLHHGVRSDATSNGVVLQGNMNDAQNGTVAVYTRIFRIAATHSGVTRYATSDGSGSLVSRVSPDNATGVPDRSDVRGGTLYGYNNELSGSLTMPPVQAVKYGVPVGNTTGTGEFDLGRAVTVLGEAIALGMTTGSRQ